MFGMFTDFFRIVPMVKFLGIFGIDTDYCRVVPMVKFSENV